MNSALRNILESDRLPTLPEVARRVVEIARSPEPDLGELTSVIRADAVIAARLLRTVNSALFGLRHRSASIDAAIPLLGVTLVRTLVLGFSLADHRGKASLRSLYRQLWRVSLINACTAELLAERLGEVAATGEPHTRGDRID